MLRNQHTHTHTHIRTASFDLRGGYTPINLPREYHCGFRALSALLASDLLCLRCPSTSVNNSSRGPRVVFPHSRSGQAAGPARLLVTNHVRHDAWRQPSVTGTSGENKRAGWKTKECVEVPASVRSQRPDRSDTGHAGRQRREDIPSEACPRAEARKTKMSSNQRGQRVVALARQTNGGGAATSARRHLDRPEADPSGNQRGRMRSPGRWLTSCFFPAS